MQLRRNSMRWVWLWLGAVVLLGTHAFADEKPAEKIQAVYADANRGVLWFVEQTKDEQRSRLTIYTSDSTSLETLQKQSTRTGRVMAGGVAAVDSTLMLVYEGGLVQRLQMETQPNNRTYLSTHQIGSLPHGTEVLALAGMGNHLFAVVRVEEPADLALILQQRRDAFADLLPPLPNHTDTSADIAQEDAPVAALSEQMPAEEPSPSSAARLLPEAPMDLLLVRVGNRWLPYRLPKDWPAENQPQLLVQTEDQDASVQLFAYQHEAEQAVIKHWQADITPSTLGNRPDEAATNALTQDTQSWQTGSLHVPEHQALAWSRWRVLKLNDQLVVVGLAASSNEDAHDVAAQVWLIHDEKLLHLGSPVLEATGETWFDRIAIAGIGSRASVFVWPAQTEDEKAKAEKDVRLVQVSLEGRILPEQTLTTQPMQQQGMSADQLLTMIVLGVTTILLIATWPREVRRGRVNLADDWEPAFLSKRVLAGLIDFAPWILFSMWWFDLSFEKMSTLWPGQGQPKPWAELAPPLMVVGMYVAYMTLSESIFGNTVGKQLFRLHVVTVTGAKPAWWAIVLRNLLRVLDVIAWVPLVLPLLWPNRQRLADVVAQTLVVQKREAKKKDDPKEN